MLGRSQAYPDKGIVSLCSICHYSSLIDFPFEKYIVSTGHRHVFYHQRRRNENADGETCTHNQCLILTLQDLMTIRLRFFIFRITALDPYHGAE